MPSLSLQSICSAVRELVSAEETSLGVEVTLPVAYPGGDLVTVVVEQSGSRLRVHDAGFAAMRLTQTGVTLGKSVNARLKDYAARFNCKFSDGRVFATSDSIDLAVTVALVANGSRSVADYALEIKRHAEADFRHLLSEVIREIVGKRLRENEELRGKSGRKYRVSAVILDENEAYPIRYVVPVANRGAVPSSFAMLYDIGGVCIGAEANAVYDETEEFRGEDRALLAVVGDVLSFSQAKIRYRALMGNAVGTS